MTTINGEAIANAVQLANDFRALLDGTKIDDLPKGYRRSANQCILAKAFNFDCIVSTYEGGWAVYFYQDEEDGLSKAHKLATVLNKGVNSYMSYWVVPLPEQIGHIAYLFDAGRMPEYDLDYNEGMENYG